MPGGESGRQVLDRIVPVLTKLRIAHLDDHDWQDDIVVVSHGAAIRLVAAVLAGVDGLFALDHHLANTESVVLSPITDGRWSCVHWGELAPPFYADKPPEETVPDPISGAPQSSVHSARCPMCRMTVPWQWARPSAHSRQCAPGCSSSLILMVRS